MGKLLYKKPKYLELINPSKWIESIKITRKRKIVKIIILSFVFGILLFFLESKLGGILIQLFGPLFSDENIFTEMAQFSFPLFLLSIALIPIFEEWIFRAILLEEISDWSRSRLLGLISSSLLFAIFHLTNPGTYVPALLFYFVGGLLIGVVYLYGGLALAVFTHIIYNLSPFLFFFF